LHWTDADKKVPHESVDKLIPLGGQDCVVTVVYLFDSIQIFHVLADLWVRTAGLKPYPYLRVLAA